MVSRLNRPSALMPPRSIAHICAIYKSAGWPIHRLPRVSPSHIAAGQSGTAIWSVWKLCVEPRNIEHCPRRELHGALGGIAVLPATVGQAAVALDAGARLAHQHVLLQR